MSGERYAQIEKLRNEREDYIKQIDKMTKSLQKTEKDLLKLKKSLENPGNLKNLMVIWEQDGEKMQIGPLGEATPLEFLRAVDAIPRSVRAKFQGNRLSELEKIRGELNAIPRKYKQQKTELETKIYRCDARIAQLQEEGL